MSTVTMWKPPLRREYAPKPMDPGQVIVWTVRIPARWTVPPRYDSEAGTFTEGIGWTEALEYERIGTVWSAATSASSWWAVPDDDEGNPVVVRRAGKREATGWRPEGTLYESGECAGWRDGIRRAENVRRRGIYAVVHETYTVPRTYGSREAHEPLMWHCDPDCREAEGRERDDGKDGHAGYRINRHAPSAAGGGAWTVNTVTDVLVGRVHLTSPAPFCPRCVMLEPEPARELVTA